MKPERNCLKFTEPQKRRISHDTQTGRVAPNQAIFRKIEQDACFIINHTGNKAQFTALTAEEQLRFTNVNSLRRRQWTYLRYTQSTDYDLGFHPGLEWQVRLHRRLEGE